MTYVHPGRLLVLFVSSFFVMAHAQAQQLEWVRQLGTGPSDWSLGVSGDAIGNVYITGYTGGTLGGARVGGDDVFVSKYDTQGTLQWTSQLGTAYDEEGNGISVNSQGDIYITGFTRGSLDGVNAGGFSDAFVTKYNSLGNVLWTRQLGTAGGDLSYGVSADLQGSIYVAGTTGGNLDGLNAGLDDVFVGKYDSSGTLLWIRQIGTEAYDEGYGVSADSQGNVFITGVTGGSLGGPNAGSDDSFLTKYDAMGNLQWIRQIGTANDDYSDSVATDSQGNVYISGYTSGSLGGTFAGGVGDVFVTKFDALGDLIWMRQLGTSRTDWSTGICVDLAGSIYITGLTGGNLGGPSAGGIDTFLIELDALGNVVWTRQLGTARGEAGNGVFADSIGNIYIAGNTVGNLGGPNAGSEDAFVAKYSTVPEPSLLVLGVMPGIGLLVARRR